jgi:predicted RNA-binding Zn-ribbon protein involved in translation (DUF1610 family)
MTKTDKLSWKAEQKRRKVEFSKRARATVTAVVCPICGAKRGDRCTFTQAGKRHRLRKGPHTERVQKARAVFRQQQKRGRQIRAMQARKWATVTVTYVCPICGGDHARADHNRATDTLLKRAREAQR